MTLSRVASSHSGKEILRLPSITWRRYGNGRQAHQAMKRANGYQRASGIRENTRIHGEHFSEAGCFDMRRTPYSVRCKRFKLVPGRGIEPPTHALRMRCSTN